MASSKDLKDKLWVAAEVLQKNGAEALFAALYKVLDESAEGTASAGKRASRESKVSSLTKWYSGATPTTRDTDLFRRLSIELNLDVEELTLMECSARQFVAYLSTKDQLLLKDRAKITGHEWLASLLRGDEEPVEEVEEFDQVIYRSLTLNFADKADAWEADGQVDQKFMYLNLNSVENWRAVLKDGNYKNYPRCKETLTELLEAKDAKWSKESGNICTIVIFGAGTPEKEVLIIKNLLKQERFSEQNKLRVVIVDASVYMLVDTYVHIRKELERAHVDKCVEIVQCWADFLRMQPHLRRIRPKPGTGRVAFFLMGGTIGNIDEGKFLGSVYSVSEPNDILVVSAEFISGAENRAEYVRALVEHYSGDGAKDLVLEPIRRLLDERGITGDVAARRSYVTPKLVEKDPNLSPIPGTVGVVLQFDRRGLKLELSQSKRYDFEAFSTFFEDRHFHLLSDLPCRDFPPYRQLMFVRKAS